MRTRYRPARPHPSTEEAMAGAETLHGAITKRQEEARIGMGIKANAIYKSCGAEIRWVTMAKTGKAMPLDARPEKRVIIVGQDDAGEDLAAVVDAYTSHFVTCPQAGEHRRRGEHG